jgi:hypothetical protein
MKALSNTRPSTIRKILPRKRLGQTRHHIINRCHGGPNEEWNILWIYQEKHDLWHTLFKNYDLDGAIALLERVKRLKEKQKRREI